MKGWITAALVVTFLSGGTTGYLLGHDPTPPAPEDPYIRALKAEGVTRPADVERVREILREREERIRALSDKVMLLLRDQIEEINTRAAAEVQEIIDSYRQPSGQDR